MGRIHVAARETTVVRDSAMRRTGPENFSGALRKILPRRSDGSLQCVRRD